MTPFMNFDLFSDTNTRIDIEIPDGKLCLYPNFFEQQKADNYFNLLMKNIHWKQEKIFLYGKEHDVPRLSAWYGDEGKSYEYSGIHAKAIPWDPSLLAIKEEIEAISNERFNSVLVNQYRDGSDGVAWHSDDEPELGIDPIIASVSFGEERQFQLKHKKRQITKSLILPHGSLLLMGKKTQLNWLHQIPKSKRLLKSRINLTYRLVNNS